MNIKSFEKQFNPTILKRGYNYYMNNQVDNLIRIDSTNWQAEVNGTHTYVVDIQINENGDIVYADCDCPYEDDCKHMVAVLYEIRNQQHTAPLHTLSVVTKKPPLRELLQSQSREQLIELITKVGQNHPGFLQELELLFATPEDTLEAAKKLTTHYIYEAQEHKGLIPWNQDHQGLYGIQTVHERINKLIENEDYLPATQLSILCFHHALDVVDMGDDHDGNFSYSIEESTALIDQAVLEGVDIWNEAQCEKAYNLITEEVMNPKINEWSEFRISLLQTCIPLCQHDAIEERFLELLHLLRSKSDDLHSSYFNNHLKELELQLIASKYGQQQAEAFLENNLDNANMREQLILSSMERNDFEKILKLATDGIKIDYDKRGTVNKWRRLAYKASKELGNQEDMRKYAFELLRDGDYDYYGELKLLSSNDEWTTTLETVLNTLKKNGSSHYTKILINEKQTKRLLDYCQEQPSRIEQYYPHMKEDYYEDVCALFIETITKRASNASNRKRYQEVFKTIKTMQKAGYTFEAKQLIADLLEAYPKRRAFVEELRKLK